MRNVMITFKHWIITVLPIVYRSDYVTAANNLYDKQIDCLNKDEDIRILKERLKQVTFLENRVQELEIEVKKQVLAPRKAVEESQPIITGRAGWRAIAQMRSQSTIPGPEDDSVKKLEHKAAKEANV